MAAPAILRDELAALARHTTSSGENTVLAETDLRAGDVVIPRWNEDFYRDMEGWAHLSVAEVLALPAEQRALFFRYGLDEDFDRIAGPLHERHVTTLDNFINHSCAPNLVYNRSGDVVAARDIARGEELSIDYGCFTVNFDEHFDCRCGAPECRGRVTRDDWQALARRHGFDMPVFLHDRIARLLAG